MHRCESWTIKKTGHQRIDAFEQWCWRRLFGSPLERIQPVNPKGNKAWIFTGRTNAKGKGPILWLPPDSLENTLILEKIEGRRRRGWQRMRGLNDIADSMGMNLSKLQEIGEDRGAWLATVHGVAKSQIQLSDWIRTTTPFLYYYVKRYFLKECVVCKMALLLLVEKGKKITLSSLC